MMIEFEFHERYASIRLNDPAKRNALSIAMFDALDEALARIEQDETVQTLLLTGNGSVFCAGFDLAAAVEKHALLREYIVRLSALNRALRRLPQVVIAAVHGAAIAGGCALLSACDVVIASPDAKLGYPVHPIGVSPAVTIPTLQQAIGAAGARALLMEGDLISGRRAHEIGLVTHLASSADTLSDEAHGLAKQLASKPPHAMRVTKAWLNELDGSLDDAIFDRPADASAAAADTDEAREMLQSHWRGRESRPHSA